MKIAWYKKTWVTILLHSLVWILLFSLPFLLRPQDKARSAGKEEYDLASYIINDILWVILFYLNAFLLVPRILYPRKGWWFTLSHLVLFTIYLLLMWANHLYLRPSWNFLWGPHIFFTSLIYTFFFFASTAYQLIKDRMAAEEKQKEKENENLKTELSLLRSQVSPHFMFNVLNNMVALARKQSDQLEPSLIKLSSLMRYMLYETEGDKVSLEKEIEYLQSYIDLQQQRYGKKLKLEVNLNNMDRSYDIDPMLLIPFVENAFKHGTGFIEDPIIKIDLSAGNGYLYFEVMNKYQDQIEEIKDATSGIGLANVKRRLELLYGKNHQLTIDKKDGWFKTSLQLKLTA
ncbi:MULTISPECIES: sensor histidine kinase [unclassified Paraflavitalea]|uniref:sensor histidine kinase n=1 Tax=unclassified Paraflavitalea TaxID=2798305 RepID=UPI003D3450B0